MGLQAGTTAPSFIRDMHFVQKESWQVMSNAMSKSTTCELSYCQYKHRLFCKSILASEVDGQLSVGSPWRQEQVYFHALLKSELNRGDWWVPDPGLLNPGESITTCMKLTNFFDVLQYFSSKCLSVICTVHLEHHYKTRKSWRQTRWSTTQKPDDFERIFDHVLLSSAKLH
jgi:hypothetical protein